MHPRALRTLGFGDPPVPAPDDAWWLQETQDAGSEDGSEAVSPETVAAAGEAEQQGGGYPYYEGW